MSSKKLTESFTRAVPDGDTIKRAICNHCDHVSYRNPKIVVNTLIVTDDERFLLCRRAIEPGKGLWTHPGGFMENGETRKEGAKREAWEEAGVSIEIGARFAEYELLRAENIQLYYRAKLLSPDFEAGPESLEVKLFSWDEVPWDELAFPTTRQAFLDYRDTKHKKDFAPIERAISSSEKPPVPKKEL